MKGNGNRYSPMGRYLGLFQAPKVTHPGVKHFLVRLRSSKNGNLDSLEIQGVWREPVDTETPLASK